MTVPAVDVTPVDSAAERSVLRTLLTEYHQWMRDHEPRYDPETELDADFQALAAGPETRAWVARLDDTPTGCVLLHGVTDDLAEFKRLWTSPDHRGHGVGRQLVQTVVDAARERGHRTLGLTTPPWSEAAQALYESLGFERTPPYPETLLPEQYHDDAIFMQLDLTAAGSRATDQ